MGLRRGEQDSELPNHLKQTSSTDAQQAEGTMNPSKL